jgi:phospholipid/cholesterol/gamma-HCH transport system permease protein
MLGCRDRRGKLTKKPMTRVFQKAGNVMLDFVALFGQVGALLSEVVGAIVTGKVRWSLVGQQIVRIGVGSQLVVMVTGAFTGAVFAAQAYFKFNELGLGSATGPVVSVALCRELGPVLAALMVTSRVGSAMTAEIGTMRVYEQVDALRSMGVHPVDYLVVPRIIAMVISLPILVGEAIAFGIVAADMLTVHGFGLPQAWFRHQVIIATGPGDLATGLIKGLVFAVLIVLICCNQGLRTSNGAAGVGRATTTAVVNTSLAILISNLALTLILNQFLPIVSLSL